MIKYDYKITFKSNDLFNLEYIKNKCKHHPNSTILVEIQNTKGITSSMISELGSNVLVRIAGGYDEDRVKRRKNFRFSNGETGEYYTSAVIYTRNETINILREIEKIESGINKSWSDIQKLLYIYDRLRNGIMYDPKFEHKLSSETRSLRGLITKQTVCAGYSMIFKEFMDRNNIECEYVEGFTNPDKNIDAHAWNIVKIEGKKYPIDLTWDNSSFRSGKFNTFEYIGQDIQQFSKCHRPMVGEKTQNYAKELSPIDPQIIN